MKETAGSLNNLRDLAEPAPVGWWPFAPGWWVLLALLALFVLVVAIKAALNWRANAYRRAAIHELNAAKSDAEVAQILKRTALSAFPRDQIAALSGSRWRTWLEQSCGQTMPDAVANQLSAGVFASGATQRSPALLEFAESWVRSHPRPTRC